MRTAQNHFSAPDGRLNWKEEEAVQEMEGDVLLFFSGHPAALPLYQALEETLFALFPEAQRRVQKTQITFFHRHVFACVSFARVLRKKDQPEGSLVLTLGLPSPLSSARAAVQTEPYPGRWTCHLVLRGPEELDEELTGWLREAYGFSERK